MDFFSTGQQQIFNTASLLAGTVDDSSFTSWEEDDAIDNLFNVPKRREDWLDFWFCIILGQPVLFACLFVCFV